jgi:hypothetical protein
VVFNDYTGIFYCVLPCDIADANKHEYRNAERHRITDYQRNTHHVRHTFRDCHGIDHAIEFF